MGVEKSGDVEKESGKGISISLTTNQRIWFLFVVPTSLCCIVYVADIATDLALIERHFSDSRCLEGVFTLILVYAPAIAFFVVTVTDDNKWPPPESTNLEKTNWLLRQIALLLFFPIHAMHRFAGRLFWSLEALLCPETEQEEALAEASKPSTAELYLLLQAFFQAAPQALLQTYILTTFKIPQERTGTIQVLSIVTSIASAAISAASYMRFESQRLVGRETPWSMKKPSEKVGLEPKESLMTTIESQITSDTVAENSPAENQAEEEDDSPKPPALPKGVPQSAILSLPPLPPQIRARLIKASGDELPEDLQKDYEDSEPGEPLNIRTSIHGPNARSPVKEKEAADDGLLNFDLPPLSPAPSLPDAPPPPPPFPLDIPVDDDDDLPEPPPDPREIAREEERPPETAGSKTENEAPAEGDGNRSPTTELRTEEHLSTEPLLDQSTATLQMKPTSPTKRFTSIPLPTRKWKIEGLREDDFLGKFIGFVWWFLFITSRVLALATFAFFYPWVFVPLVVLHYVGMVAYLFYCEKTKDTSTKVLRFGLGFVYIFCFIEMRTRFKNPNTFIVCFMAAGAAENVLSSVAWYFFGAWTSWWFLYAFFFIVVSLILANLAMALYFILLKPSTHDVYTN